MIALDRTRLIGWLFLVGGNGWKAVSAIHLERFSAAGKKRGFCRLCHNGSRCD